MTTDSQKVYLITPRLSGLANDLQIQTEDKQVLYHVRSRLFAPLGQVYTVYDAGEQEVMTTREDHTFVFPCHTILEKNIPIAKVGQTGIIPQSFFMDIANKPRLTMRIPIFSGIFELEGFGGTIAEIAQHRSTWIVAIKADPTHLLTLQLLALLYKEYSIGG